MTASEKLVDLLHLTGGMGVLIHDPSNMFYLTEGYTGEGFVYLTAERRVIVTDFRYTEAAEKDAPGFEVVMTDKDHPASKRLAELCEADQVRELRYESNFLSVDDYE